ncbi:MAG: hypothetical protein R8G66_12500 [Cytophagales bacterium]|nr:hypothetical protein [Cytophagales bacterium]
MRKLLTIALFSISSLIWAQTFESRSYYDEERTKLKEIITLKSSDSTLQGPYYSYFQSGSPKIEGYYIDGQPDSIWVYFYENGNKKSSGLFRRSSQMGLWDYFYESGALKASGMLAGGQKSGYWSNYFENGNEKSSGGYFKDLKEGIWNYFFEDGTVKAQAYYEAGDGLYKQFYPSGELRMEGMNKDGRSEGLWTYYYETSEEEAKGAFKEGLRDSTWIYYYKNGQVSAQGSYLIGKKTGKWTYYYENGQKSSEGILVEDQRDGQWNLYYESGEIKAKSAYTEGDGVFTEYYPSGKQKAKGEILNGKRQGKWIYFNEDGELDGEAIFDQDKGVYTGYYPNERIKMKGPMDGEKRTGEWQLFNPDGTLAGVYRPIYEEARPVFRIAQPVRRNEVNRNPVDKPEYLFKDKSIRYFKKGVNEFRALILGTNPAWILLDEFPVSLEYYYQERLGYEIQLIYHRAKFFQNVEELSFNDTYSRGFIGRIRQKFYSKESALGLLYFGHQISYSSLIHRAQVIDQLSPPFGRRTVRTDETLGAYGVFVGMRWMNVTRNPGFSVDAYVGVDMSYREWEVQYEDRAQFDPVFEDFDQSSFFFPFQFGLNFGGVFSTKAKSNQDTSR